MVEISKVGVIGAGQMGNGITHVLVLAGYDVILHDINQEQLTAATGIIEKNLARQVSKSALDSAQMEAALGRIKVSTVLEELSDCDMVIEAATENQEIKNEIFKSLSSVMRKDAIMATNTSSISVSYTHLTLPTTPYV